MFNFRRLQKIRERLTVSDARPWDVMAHLVKDWTETKHELEKSDRIQTTITDAQARQLEDGEKNFKFMRLIALCSVYERHSRKVFVCDFMKELLTQQVAADVTNPHLSAAWIRDYTLYIAEVIEENIWTFKNGLLEDRYVEASFKIVKFWQFFYP